MIQKGSFNMYDSEIMPKAFRILSINTKNMQKNGIMIFLFVFNMFFFFNSNSTFIFYGPQYLASHSLKHIKESTIVAAALKTPVVFTNIPTVEPMTILGL